MVYDADPDSDFGHTSGMYNAALFPKTTVTVYGDNSEDKGCSLSHNCQTCTQRVCVFDVLDCLRDRRKRISEKRFLAVYALLCKHQGRRRTVGRVAKALQCSEEQAKHHIIRTGHLYREGVAQVEAKLGCHT